MGLNWKVNVDGASSPRQGLEGPAGAAFIAKSDQGHLVTYKRAMRGSVNKAEVTALLLALEWAYEALKEGDTLIIHSDSEWATFCLAEKLELRYLKHYRTIKLATIFHDCVLYYGRLVKRLGADCITFKTIPREQNREADALAKAAKEEAKREGIGK